MYECNICQRQFKSKQQLGGHKTSCGVTTRYHSNPRINKKKISNGVCKYCNKFIENPKARGIHVVHCIKNPKSIETRYKIKIKAMENAQNLEIRKKISINVSKTVQEKVKNGTWHYSFSKVKTHIFQNNTYHGNWELQYAKYLVSSSIDFIRNEDKFEYHYDGKNRYYIPDFYFPSSSEYVEIKGYETEKDRTKWKYFPHKLIILKRDELLDMNVISKEQHLGKK